MTTKQDYASMRVWLPGTIPGVDPHLLTLENPTALMFFLESLAHSSHVFPADKPFDICAYQGARRVGNGTYKIHFEDIGRPETWRGQEPVKLIASIEQGEIIGVVQAAWRNMITHTKIFEGGE